MSLGQVPCCSGLFWRLRGLGLVSERSPGAAGGLSEPAKQAPAAVLGSALGGLGPPAPCLPVPHAGSLLLESLASWESLPVFWVCLAF